ncbi:O-antigen ligase family protein, partial [Escherichia coli]
MVANKPLTGFGTNSFYPTYKGYTLPAYKTWVSNNPDHSTVHNYFLLTAIEQGLPGLCIFLVLIIYML